MAGNQNNARLEQNQRKSDRRLTMQLLFVINMLALAILMTPADEAMATFITWAFSPEWKGILQGVIGAFLVGGNGLGWWAARMGD